MKTSHSESNTRRIGRLSFATSPTALEDQPRDCSIGQYEALTFRFACAPAEKDFRRREGEGMGRSHFRRTVRLPDAMDSAVDSGGKTPPPAKNTVQNFPQERSIIQHEAAGLIDCGGARIAGKRGDVEREQGQRAVHAPVSTRQRVTSLMGDPRTFEEQGHDPGRAVGSHHPWGNVNMSIRGCDMDDEEARTAIPTWTQCAPSEEGRVMFQRRRPLGGIRAHNVLAKSGEPRFLPRIKKALTEGKAHKPPR